MSTSLDAHSYVVIMAGGQGTRFWPKSRAHFPKQFLSVTGDGVLIKETWDRVQPLVGPDRTLVVTQSNHAEHARALIPELPPNNLLVEPMGRNTAPCVAWATEAILRRDPHARIAAFPADHHIEDERRFSALVEAAFAAAEDRIVLFGIRPTHPETGYGYIQHGRALKSDAACEVFAVDRFVEKPDRKTAEGYLADGRYLWNSGMLVYSASLMKSEVKRHLPDVAAGVEAIERGQGDLAAIYPRLVSISIDYAVLERSEHVAVMPAAFGWSDVGSWDAVMEIRTPDAQGNVSEGDALLIDVSRSLVDATAGRLVSVVGVDDLIVVDTKDAVLVIRRGESQRVKQVVEGLIGRGRKDLV